MHHIGKWWWPRLFLSFSTRKRIVTLQPPLPPAFPLDSGLIRPQSRYEQSYLKKYPSVRWIEPKFYGTCQYRISKATKLQSHNIPGNMTNDSRIFRKFTKALTTVRIILAVASHTEMRLNSYTWPLSLSWHHCSWSMIRRLMHDVLDKTPSKKFAERLPIVSSVNSITISVHVRLREINSVLIFIP